MTDIINDVSTLTMIPKDALLKLNDKVIWCICNQVEEDKLKVNDVSELNIGIGTLLIQNEEDTIRYKFIPSPALEANVTKTITDGSNPLKDKLEKRLIQKILNTYKTII